MFYVIMNNFTITNIYENKQEKLSFAISDIFEAMSTSQYRLVYLLTDQISTAPLFIF